MFNRIKRFFVGTDNIPRSEATPPESVCPSGYHLPHPIDMLITSPKRRTFLQQLSDNHSLPATFYRQCYLTPMYSLLSRVQNLPASEEGNWSYSGAFGDLTVQFTAYAVRMAKGRTLPPGIPPEEQAAQGLLWNAVVFWSALFYHLPLLCEWEGELDGGEGWMPGLTIPGKPFRFRHCIDKLPPSCAQGRVSLLASQLLPPSVLPWLSINPDALDCLVQRMQSRPATITLIDELLQSAAEKCGAPPLVNSPLSMTLPGEEHAAAALFPSEPLEVSALTSALPDSASAESSLTGNEPIPVMAPDVSAGETEPLPQTAPSSGDGEHLVATPSSDDTQALLSLFHGMSAPEAEEVPDVIPAITDEIGNQQEKECITLTESKVTTIFSPENSEAIRDENNKGSVFLEWLSSGLIEGKIRVNEEGSRVHIVAGFVFLCVPEIFYLFQKETGNKGKRNALQSSFERLGIHRVADGKRFLQAKIYNSPSGTGTYKNINGYLVKASSLYRGNRVPDDSALLILP
ncbi:TraI domain-containing protein [Pectobacterium cacticida]|uniref:TraI domain-containing protein n=1 Tax=Pectobacterium cacticida TaxID=69221 RepID=A0ABZ2G7Z2_9GAMM|nr:TraI domain-containing protein [Pectobacterium cacticida]UYX07860.1 TraI domain-containing protein [Pectobacterium cacticida]